MTTRAAAAPDPNRRNRMLLLVLGTGVGMGLHGGILHFFLWRSVSGLVVFLIGSTLFSATTYTLWRWVFPLLPGSTFARQLLAQFLSAVCLLGVLSVTLVSVIAHLLGAPPLVGTPGGVPEVTTITPETRQMFTRVYAILPIVPTSLIAIVCYHLVWRRMETLQTRARELGELAATAQLAALRAQINPHFLFNSLNSIAQLIHVDPSKAETCVERLAEIFRYILHRSEQEFVPLADELQMTTAYLDIERARFDDRLVVETSVDPRALRQLIPNLVLQPLVENAVKHGLSRKVGRGTLSIDARFSGDVLTLTVGDDGLGIPPSLLANVFERGVGLRNLRARLERLYGPEHLPEITSVPGEGTRVRLRLPSRERVAA